MQYSHLTCVQIIFNDIETVSPPTGVAQWVGHCPKNQKVTSWTPGQGTCLVCRPGARLEACERQPIDISLSH